MMKKIFAVALIVASASVIGGSASARTFNPNLVLVQDVVQPAAPILVTPTVLKPVADNSTKPVVDCNKIDQYIPSSVDMKELRQTWLDWNNNLRKGAGLTAYKLDPELDWSAQNWSDRAKRLGTISHKRDGSTAYYDYKKILAWFGNLGLTFANVHGSTMTENIGWGVYKCPADGSDCTPAMTKAIKTTFDFFVSEKGKKNNAHWRSLMDSDFREIGLGLALDRVKHKYYLTIHYATEITSDPKAICGF